MLTRADRVRGGRAGGLRGGQTCAERQIGVCAPGVSAYAAHLRWHVYREVVNPKCSFCSNRKKKGGE